VDKEARHERADAEPHHRRHPDTKGRMIRSLLIDEVARERCGRTKECAHGKSLHQPSSDKPMDAVREDESEIAQHKQPQPRPE
jgi:hypothetical protein